MGQTGSDTRKATITASLMGFTKWSPPEMAALFHRCSHELAAGGVSSRWRKLFSLDAHLVATLS